ncbi:MAG: esterase-like activity of phytase family protein, partial [Acetobacteraceae bacterium]|nr:esterase-like activity of phytase family protein [Acetobacteraceae bacterium]
ILRLSPPLPTENYEAIAAARHGGRTLIAVLADDNENMLQRNLLLVFAGAEG